MLGRKIKNKLTICWKRKHRCKSATTRREETTAGIAQMRASLRVLSHEVMHHRLQGAVPYTIESFMVEVSLIISPDRFKKRASFKTLKQLPAML